MKSGNDVIMDERNIGELMDIYEKRLDRLIDMSIGAIEELVDALKEKLDKVEKKLDKVIEFSETIQAKYLEDKLEKELQSGKLHLKFIKETEKALDDEAKEYYGGE